MEPSINRQISSKKMSFASNLVVASGLLFIFICLVLIFDHHEYQPVAITNGELAQPRSVVRHYNVDYPVFHIEKIDIALRNYVTHQVEDFIQTLGPEVNDPSNTMTIKYTIVHYGTHTATVIFHEQKAVTGKQGAMQDKLFSFDLQSQKELAITDVFKGAPNAEVLLSKILHDYFQHDKPGIVTLPELDRLQELSISDINGFVFDDESIIFYINVHTPGQKDASEPIAIKREVLADALNTEFIAPDRSVIDIEPVLPVYAIIAMPQHDIVIDPSRKMLALTFDDGPGVLTPKVLDVLKKYSARATFFLIGRQVSTYAATVQREIREGNEVGNHSWSHPNLTKLPYAGLQQQVVDTQRAIQQAADGYTPRLMRPPEGAYNATVTGFLQSQGLHMQLWNVDTLDWLNHDAQVVYGRIMAGAGDGKVILVHDIHLTSVDAVTRAIPDLVAQGYQLVTVSQLEQYR
jgi:peptidoglycan/xylan/chitin deacetylase (PgdA/CDA1 family)